MTGYEKLIIELNGLKAQIRIILYKTQEQWDEIPDMLNFEDRLIERERIFRKQDSLMKIIQSIREMIKDYNNQVKLYQKNLSIKRQNLSL